MLFVQADQPSVSIIEGGKQTEVIKSGLGGILSLKTSFVEDTLKQHKSSEKNFFCVPYECSMLMSACVKRQQRLLDAGSKKIRRGMGFASAASMQIKFEKCINCKQGKDVVEQLGVKLNVVYVNTPIPEDIAADLDIQD